MSGGTGVSSLGGIVPNDAYNSSLIKSAYPLGVPHGMGGNTQVYESKGGYVPEKHNIRLTPKKRGNKLTGGRRSRRSARQGRHQRTARKHRRKSKA